MDQVAQQGPQPHQLDAMPRQRPELAHRQPGVSGSRSARRPAGRASTGAADHGLPDRHPGRLARTEGSCGVVADVVETPWTGSETRDVARHYSASSSAHAGLGRRSDPPWMGTGLLITQRSRVQIPPPLLVPAGQGPFLTGRGPLRDRECDQRKVPVPYATAGQVRRAGTERDCVKPGRRCRSRSLGAWPRSTVGHRRPCWPVRNAP